MGHRARCAVCGRLPATGDLSMPDLMASGVDEEPVLEVDAIVTRFGRETIHDGVSFRVARGEVIALIGGSGTGKSVLVKEVIGLVRPRSGTIRLLGTDVWNSDRDAFN